MEGFYIVRAIVCAKVKVTRIAHRDQQSYFGILLDDNKTIIIGSQFADFITMGRKSMCPSLILGKRRK
jgi:hypothetical protein